MFLAVFVRNTPVSKTARRRFRSALLVLIALGVAAWLAAGERVSLSSSEKAIQVTNQAVEKARRPWLNVKNISSSPSKFIGSSSTVRSLQDGSAQPLTLATGDFDLDGAPDLLIGYATSSGGVVSIRRGNIDAFAPTDPAVFQAVQQGSVPPSLLSVSQTFAIADAPDFLQVGDFNQDGSLDVVTAARGGQRLNFLAGDMTGSLSDAVAVNLGGQVTTLSVGQFNRNGKTHVAVGINGTSGPAVEVFSSLSKGAPVIYPLAAAPTSLWFGEIDKDNCYDMAVAAGSEIAVIHGSENVSEPRSLVEHIPLSFSARAVTVGQFTWDRDNRNELAVLSNDGQVHVIQAGDLDTRPLTEAEIYDRTHGDQEVWWATHTAETGIDPITGNRVRGASVPQWRAGQSASWMVNPEGLQVEAPTSGVVRQSEFGAFYLTHQPISDLLVLNRASQQLQVIRSIDSQLSAAKNTQSNQLNDQLSTAFDVSNEPIAVLPMPHKVNGQRDVVMLSANSPDPSIVQISAAFTVTLDRTDDVAAASACTGAGSDCSLRGAVNFANANAGGVQINVPANTYNITLSGTEDLNATGDLDLDPTSDGVAFVGAGASTTIIQVVQGSAPNERIFQVTPGNTPTTGWDGTWSGITMQNGGSAGPILSGGAILMGGTDNIYNFFSCVFQNNDAFGAVAGNGGAVSQSAKQNGGCGQSNFTNCTFTSNAAASGVGGAIRNLGGTTAPLGTETTTVTGGLFDSNQATTNEGGGVFHTIQTGTSNYNKIQFKDNKAFTTGAANPATGGGGIQKSNGDINVLFCRFRGNTAGTVAQPGVGEGVKLGGNGNLNAANSWWGCNTDPFGTDGGSPVTPAAGCDSAFKVSTVTGTLTTLPQLLLKNTASPAPIVTGQTTTLTASVNENSASVNVSPNLIVLLDLGVTWNNPVRGLLSNQVNALTSLSRNITSATEAGSTVTITTSVAHTFAAGQTVLISGVTETRYTGVYVILTTPTSTTFTYTNPITGLGASSGGTAKVSVGTATATFRASAAGAGSADATVDSALATANFTINKADTTSTITSDTPDPTVTGQPFTVNFSLAVNPPGSNNPTVPTGNVTITADTGEQCTGSIDGSTPAVGSCSITVYHAGNRTLTAVYNGDANFNVSPASTPATAHLVNKADTTTAITSDNPDPSVTGESVTVAYTVNVTAPGSALAGNPTGTVTVTDNGNPFCSGSVAGTGSCSAVLTTAGSHTFVATYGGDANYNASPASPGATHTVNKADTTTVINSDNPDPSVTGQSVTVAYTVSVTSPGTAVGTFNSGNVVVTDNGNPFCNATVLAGQCSAVLTTAVAHSFVATYQGDANYNASPGSAAAAHTVNKANTTASIITDLPDPTVTGESVTVTYSVAVTSPGAGTPTGNVVIMDGANTVCTALVSDGSCSGPMNVAGARNLTATYQGDTNFNASPASANAPHQVNKADTTTTITSDNPDPSTPGQLVTVQWNFAVTAPGGGSPTGNVDVTVSGGVETCSAAAAAGQCSLVLNGSGTRTITANYPGDANYNTSSDTESHVVCGDPQIVTSIADNGPGTLRQALLDVCDNGSITFDTAGVFATPQTITLSTGELVVNANVTIDGPDASHVTIDGGAASRVFHISPGKTVTIRELTVQNGNTAANGAGIWNDHGTLTVLNSDVTTNTSTSVGGGIYNDATGGGAATLYVVNSTLRANTAFEGGALYNYATAGGVGQVYVTNSTLSGNNATGSGGGISALETGGSANVTINSSTITGNRADNDNDTSGTGGGIFFNAATVTLRSTIVAGNLNENGASDSPDDINGGAVTAGSSNNLIGDAATAGGLTDGANGNLVGNAGVGTIDINTVLDPTLANNGGFTLTHKLVTGSPAIDKAGDLTTLNGAIDNVVTSITVTDANPIPANVGFVIQIESEQMTVTAKVGNVLTVTRGANATTAAAHNNGVAVNPAFDQRGSSRLGDDPNVTNAVGGIDIGAYEALTAPATPDLDAASDSGPSSTDNYTSDNTPTFTINGVSNGATVELLADGNPVASGVAAGTSIQLTSSLLSDATYSFAARQTVGGDTSPNSPGLSVTIDIGTPGTPTIDLQPGSDTGNSNSDDKTNATTRTFDIGNTEAGATVELLRDGNPITSVVSGGGTVQLSDSTAFVSGTTYAYTARQTDQAGNNASSGAVNVLIDSTAPAVSSIVRANANPTSAANVDFTVTFSEDVTGVGTSDFALTTTGSISGAFISTATVGTNVYTITVNTGTGSGTIRLDLIDNGSIADTAGNELGGAGVQNFTTGEVYDVDKSAPTADITDVTPDPRNTAVSSITIVFSEAITGFDMSDLTLTRNGGGNLLTGGQTLTSGDNITWTLGNLSGLTGTGGTYLLTLTASGSGIVDNVANPLAGDASDSWVMDITGPTVTINQAAGQSDPAGGAAGIDFTAVFSEPVTGFTNTDVSFSGAGSTTATVTEIAPNDGTTYNVQITGMSVAGVVTASINLNAAQDAAGNLSAASTSTDNQVTYTPCSLSPVVTTNADSGAGSLRQAILDACDGATITFSGVVSPITLTTGQLVINKNLTIQGPTASGLTISGNSNGRVFDVTSSNVNISNLTVANGLVAAGDGGGLRNASAGTVTLTGMTFTANQAVNGGAIATTAGAMVISNSTISGNTATTEGGGLYVNGGNVTLLNDTITNNTATGGQAGGLRRVSGTVDVRNTIVAGNTAPVNPNVVGAINDLGNNILSGNPLLAALANNGGPTMTHALLAGSPALDAGDNTAAASLTTDQRGAGFGRLRDAASDADTTQTVDIGAFEADPSIEDITDKGTSEDTPLSFSFRVGDSFSAFDSITATSSNLTLVPNANLGITGSGATRNLNITPAANQSGTSTITVSITKTTSGTPVTMTDTFVLSVSSVPDAPSVTNTTTNEDTQSSGGLVITKNAADGAEITHFKITNITGGTLYKNDGVTPIANNSFINLAEGGAGLKFTPTPNSVVTGTFQVQASTDAVGTQLSPAAATAMIFITPIADTPTVTNAITNEDQQSLAGLVINRNAVDGAEVTHFKITGITGGTLYKTDTVTVINNGDFITIGEGNTGLRFTPAPNTHSPGTFEFKVQGATSNAGAGLSGFATATITVNPIADTPSVTSATTNEDIQTTSGLVLNRNAADGAETSHFKITNITNGTLFKNNGTTVINNNDFITFAEGNAGLKFTPAANLFSPTTTFSFQVQAAEDAVGTGISSAVTATITVNSSNDAPSFTKGADQTVAENAGAQTVNNWATALSKGPANESGQTLSFQITNNTNPGLFQTLPAVSSTGTLTYTPAPNVSGTAAITLVIKDDGGTANGGVDTSAPQTFNITVNDAGVVQLSSATYSVLENNGPAVITINRVGGSAGTVEVYVNTSNGTATLADYTPLTNQLVTFNNGETTKTVNIPITNDLFNEPDVTVNVSITNVSWNTVLGSPTSAVLTIVNDDPVGGYLKLSSSNYTVFEGGVATITVQRVGSLNGQVSVDYSTSDNSNPPSEQSCAPTPGNTMASSRCDFTTAFGRITFAAGDGADKTFTVLINQDNYVEGPETVVVSVANVMGGAALATPTFANLTIEDDTMEPAANPVDDTATFVEQLYRDFLNRPSDPAGKAFWVNNIDKCLDPAQRLPGQTQAQCYEVQRINTAASFFLSIEFQATGGTAYLANKVSFNARPTFQIFERDAQQLGKGYVFGQPGAEAILEANKVAYFNAFVVRPSFTPIYGSLTNAQYVDALIANTGVSFTMAERDALVNGLNAATETRATVLRKITEKDTFKAIEFNPMFVQMEYFGFLRRNPDTAGFDFWLGKLNAANGDYIAAEMIKAFITSIEYRGRFGP